MTCRQHGESPGHTLPARALEAKRTSNILVPKLRNLRPEGPGQQGRGAKGGHQRRRQSGCLCDNTEIIPFSEVQLIPTGTGTQPQLAAADLTHELSLSRGAGTPWALFQPWPWCHADPVSPTRTACLRLCFCRAAPPPRPRLPSHCSQDPAENDSLVRVGGGQKGPKVNQPN